MNQYAWLIGSVVLLSGIAAYATILHLLRTHGEETRGKRRAFFASVRSSLIIPLALWILLLSGAAFLPAVPLVDSWQQMLAHAVRVALIAASCWLVVRGLAVGRELLLLRHDIQVEDNLEARRVFTQIRVIERLLAGAVLVVGLALILMTFDRMRQVGVSLVASAGVIGIIIGFAAQKTIATVLAGLQIALTQPIRLDDVVIIEGEWGRIEEITLTYVVVKIWDLRRLVVPIQHFIDHPFQNWTRTTSAILGTVFIHSDYRLPVEEMRKKLGEILESSPLWDRKAWCLQVTDANASTLELRALMSARSSPEAWDLRCIVREKLVGWLQETYPEYLPKTRIALDAAGQPGQAAAPPSSGAI